MNFNCIILFLVITVNISEEVLDTSSQLLARKKRWIIWRPGINWMQMVVGFGLPIEVRGTSITWGAVLKSYYLLPNNATYYTNPLAYIDVSSRKKTKRSTSRWDLYSVLERFTESMGYENGRACLLRAICELAAAPLDTKTGLLSEILHVLLTPTSTTEDVEHNSNYEYHAAENKGRSTENCSRLFPDCSYNLIREFTRVLTSYI